MSATESREKAAILADAETRVRELQNVKRVLWPDRHLELVAAEIESVDSELRAAEGELR